MGTDFMSYNNVITNLKYFLKSYPICEENCKIHSGFMNHYKSLENSLIKNIVELNKDYPSASVIVTGHSLGGAIATLARLKLEIILPSDVNITLITFGSPKVGNAAFADCMNHLRSLSYRFVRIGDFVTNLPPFPRFVHSGIEIDEALFLDTLNP